MHACGPVEVAAAADAPDELIVVPLTDAVNAARRCIAALISSPDRTATADVDGACGW